MAAPAKYDNHLIFSRGELQEEAHGESKGIHCRWDVEAGERRLSQVIPGFMVA